MHTWSVHRGSVGRVGSVGLHWLHLLGVETLGYWFSAVKHRSEQYG